MRHVEITYRATLEHQGPVTSCWVHALLLPRTTREQVVHRAELTVSPAQRELRNRTEFNGNLTSYIHVTEPHSRLELTARALVSVDRPLLAAPGLPQLSWDEAAAIVRSVRTTGRSGDGRRPSPLSVLSIAAGSLPSDMVPASERALNLALDTFVPGQSLAAGVLALNQRVHRSFEPAPAGPPGSGAALEDALEARRGSSQDLAHVMIAALRSVGLAAMYVSGYLDTATLAGREALRSSGACHAWVAVWFPGRGWVHLDPSNGVLIDNRHVIIGWGRDSADVWPLRVVVQSERAPALSEATTVRPLGPDELAARLQAAGA